MNWWTATTALFILENTKSPPGDAYCPLDASLGKGPTTKAINVEANDLAIIETDRLKETADRPLSADVDLELQRLGDSPFAVVLEPLGQLARAAKRPIGGSTVEQLIADYASEGWRCDRAAIEALARLKPGRENDLVQSVVRALYEPWLDASARRLQELLDDGRIDPAKLASRVSAARETCVLFADGLRFDLGMRLLEKLEARGLRTRMAHRFAPIPTVTPTAKPLASPAHASCIRGNDAEGFCPVLTEGSKPVNAQRLRDAMARQGIKVLEPDETRMAVGAEAGGWADLLVHQIEPELEAIADRVSGLLNAGWSAVRVVTDLALLRMVPFVESNYNLVELGPRGTGKSHLFQQISPYAHLISGGKVTVAKMFVNNATGQRGLVCQYDVVCFDEVSGISFIRRMA